VRLDDRRQERHRLRPEGRVGLQPAQQRDRPSSAQVLHLLLDPAVPGLTQVTQRHLGVRDQPQSRTSRGEHPVDQGCVALRRIEPGRRAKIYRLVFMA
jgi:hypothetical protein